MSLAKTTWELPLAMGMDSKPDPRALKMDSLAVCKNAEFNEVGGIQKRKPYSNLTTSSNIRRIVPNGDELLVFTKDTLYSWNAQGAALVSRGTHLAVKMQETPRFVNTADQVASDRAELNGVVVICWTEKGASNDSIYWSAYDKTTGAVLRDRIGGSTGTRPRLVVTTNRIILFFEGNPNLLGQAFDPASLPTSLSASTVYSQANGYSSGAYDVVASGTTCYLVATRTVNTSYEIMTVSESLVVSRVTKARPCDSGIAIAAAPNGTHLQVLRSDGAAVEGDYLTIAGPFTDVTVNQAIFATAAANIGAAYRSTQDGGQYRCYAFTNSQVNYVDTGGAIGTAATHVLQTALTSRAFDHDGRVYIWRSFDETSGFSGAGVSGLRAALQNTYFLYRDDGFLVAKAANHKSCGDREYSSNLPQVQSLGSGVFAWCGGEKRVVSIGQKHKGYAARAPREIIFTFDSNEARRVARLGPTLYISGGEILQYDGAGLYETGFHVYPWYFGAIELASAGAVANGSYTLKVTWRWDNARGERDRSTTATHGTVDITAGPNSIQVATWQSLPITHKTTNPPAVEVWRTLADPTIDAPFYLVTAQDPADLTGANCYVPNTYQTAALAAFEDALADADVALREANDETASVLERLAPPPATIVVSTQERLFLAGISDNPYAIWYSRLRGSEEVASFHDALVIEVPPTGGAITGLGFLNETLIVFCETAVFALPGDGFDNTGGGNNYGPARLLSSDVGAINHESIVLTPQGLIFKSSKGWYLLNKGWGVDYIGGPVSSFDSDTIVAAHVMESTHQVRILGSSSRMLVWDYLVNQWSEWTVTDGVSACIWNGTYHIATSSAVKAEQSTYSAADYHLDIETAWIRRAGFRGFQRIWYRQSLGEYRSAHDLRIRIARDYSDSDASGPTWADDRYWSPEATTVGGRLQVRHGLASPQQCEAIKVRITDYQDGSTTVAPAGEALRLTALALEVGVKPRSLYKQLASGAKQ